MSVILICPVCEKKYSVSDESKAGGRRCQQCSTELYLDLDIEIADNEGSAFGYAGVPSLPNISVTPQELPKKIDRFQIRSLLGAGAFGRVFRAFDTKLRREVALKVPHAGLIDGPKARARFFREAIAGARLLHANIVQVYDTGQDGDQIWIASAYIKGRTLKQILEMKPTGFEWPANVIRNLAAALSVAHKARILHRDVKPANIMIDKRGEPYLMDFGLAWLKDAANTLTHQGAIMGTPAYMSPEQAAGMKLEQAFASDQYSLGVVFYEMLCHVLPFEGPAEFVIACHKTQVPLPARDRDPSIPWELEAICMKMLAKNASERYPDCQAVADDLQRWRDRKPIKAIPIARPLPETRQAVANTQAGQSASPTRKSQSSRSKGDIVPASEVKVLSVSSTSRPIGKPDSGAGRTVLLRLSLVAVALLVLCACIGTGIGGYFYFLSNPLVGKWATSDRFSSSQIEFGRTGSGRLNVKTINAPGGQDAEFTLFFEYTVTRGDPMVVRILPRRFETKGKADNFDGMELDKQQIMNATVNGDTLTLVSQEDIARGLNVPLVLRRMN